MTSHIGNYISKILVTRLIQPSNHRHGHLFWPVFLSIQNVTHSGIATYVNQWIGWPTICSLKRSVKRYQKSIRLGEPYNEFTHQIWPQNNQRFVWQCAETGQSKQRLGININSSRGIPNKFPPPHLSSIASQVSCKCVEAARLIGWREFNEAWPKFRYHHRTVSTNRKTNSSPKIFKTFVDWNLHFFKTKCHQSTLLTVQIKK